MIRLICGLGNPGDKYAETRHNAGFWFLGRLVDRYEFTLVPNKEHKALLGEFRFPFVQGGAWVRICAPQNYMNRSGEALAPLARYYDIAPSEILVVHDEIDLLPGVARLKQGGGHGGHNGLRDIIRHLGSADFLRLRVGVGRHAAGEDGAAHVLKRPPASEMHRIEAAMSAASDVMDSVLNGDYPVAMNQLHTDT